MLRNLLGRVINKSISLQPDHLCQSCTALLRRHKFSTSSTACGVFEPDDMNLGPEIPEYEALNIRVRAYDFVTLESYAKYVHNFASQMGLESDMWPTPTKTSRVDTYKPLSTVLKDTYTLKTYERTIQLQDMPSTLVPIFLDVIRSHIPQGVNITVKEPTLEEEENRYIPDKEILELQSQMEALEQARRDRMKKK